MAKKKIITLHFKSGNSCDAKHFRIGGVNHINVQYQRPMGCLLGGSDAVEKDLLA